MLQNYFFSGKDKPFRQYYMFQFYLKYDQFYR